MVLGSGGLFHPEREIWGDRDREALEVSLDGSRCWRDRVWPAQSQPPSSLLQMASVSDTPAITPGSHVSPPPCPTPVMSAGTCLLLPGAGCLERSSCSTREKTSYFKSWLQGKLVVQGQGLLTLCFGEWWRKWKEYLCPTPPPGIPISLAWGTPSQHQLTLVFFSKAPQMILMCSHHQKLLL